MLLTYFLNDFEIVPVDPIIIGIIFVFTFHMRCISSSLLLLLLSLSSSSPLCWVFILIFLRQIMSLGNTVLQLLLLLLLLLLSSLSSPLRRVFILIFLRQTMSLWNYYYYCYYYYYHHYHRHLYAVVYPKQTMFLGYILLQLLCIYSLYYM